MSEAVLQQAEAADLIEEGRRLLDEERVLLKTGAFTAVEGLAARKAAFVERFEVLLAHPERVRAARTGIRDLIEAAQSNERLLLAAREGLAAARRRLAALVATRDGAVAYDRDGSPIRSRTDAAGKSKRA